MTGETTQVKGAGAATIPNHPHPGTAAVITDAEQRVCELRNVARALWPDRDDPEVLCELLSVISHIRSAERALKAGGAACGARQERVR